MRVDVTHHIDACEPDALGHYEYCYEYDIYRFSAGSGSSNDSHATLVARSYGDTRDEAHFLSIEVRGTPRLLRDADLETPLFAEAAAYLRSAGKHQLSWLSGRGNGYESV